MKALSVRAPWWWFILHAGKDIENRDWATGYRGTVYLHASKWWRPVEVAADAIAARDCYERSTVQPEIPGTSWEDMKAAGGCIVGKVDIVDCIRGYKRVCDASPWFFGDYGFVLANPVAFATPVPCKGALQFFTLPPDVQAAIEEMERAL